MSDVSETPQSCRETSRLLVMGQSMVDAGTRNEKMRWPGTSVKRGKQVLTGEKQEFGAHTTVWAHLKEICFLIAVGFLC